MYKYIILYSIIRHSTQFTSSPCHPVQGEFCEKDLQKYRRVFCLIKWRDVFLIWNNTIFELLLDILEWHVNIMAAIEFDIWVKIFHFSIVYRMYCWNFCILLFKYLLSLTNLHKNNCQIPNICLVMEKTLIQANRLKYDAVTRACNMMIHI